MCCKLKHRVFKDGLVYGVAISGLADGWLLVYGQSVSPIRNGQNSNRF